MLLIRIAAVNVWSTHLSVDSAGERVAELRNLQGCASQWPEARILAGDFNMQVGTSEYYAAASAFNDGWLNASNLGTAYNYSGNCDGCTRNSRIDYVFSTPWYLRVLSAQIVDTRDANGYMPSDHKPMLVTFAVD